MHGSGTNHHRDQHLLRLKRALGPRTPRFEDAGLWRKGESRARRGMMVEKAEWAADSTEEREEGQRAGLS